VAREGGDVPGIGRCGRAAASQAELVESGAMAGRSVVGAAASGVGRRESGVERARGTWQNVKHQPDVRFCPVRPILASNLGLNRLGSERRTV
jgi:hypothetical protein